MAPDFRLLANLERFGDGSMPQRFDLFAPAMSPAPGPLLFSGAAPEGFAREHAWRRLLPAVSAYALPGCTLAATGALRMVDGSLFQQEDCIPSADAAWPAAEEALLLDRPCAMPFQPDRGYAAFLTETLPRLFVLATLRQFGRPFPLLVPAELPDWMRRLLALYAAPADLLPYQPQRQTVQAPAFIVPGMMGVEGALHPAMNVMVADLLRRAGVAEAAEAPGARLYLSYHGVQGGKLSALGNEAEIAAVLDRLGFRTLQPWRMTLAAQLAAYAGAECIVSEAGPAAYNALFAPFGATLAVFGAPDRRLSRICALRGQRLAVIAPEGGFAAPRGWTIDSAMLEPFLRKLLDAAPPVIPPPPLRPIVAAPPPGGESLPAGPSLAELLASGDVVRTALFAEAERLTRVDFFHAEPIDPQIAPFGGLFSDPAYRSYMSAAIKCAALTATSVIGASGLVARGGRLLPDTMHSIDAWRPDSIVAALDVAQGARFKQPLGLPGRPLPGMWFCAVSGGWRNHAHWLTETLPLLHLFRLLRGVLPELRLLVPDFGASPAHARTLELLRLTQADMLRVGDTDILAPETLWCAPAIDMWGVPSLCRIAAQSLVAAVASQPAETAPLPGERIYLSRQGGIRHVANFAAIAPVLEEFGFAVLAPETLTLDRQIRILQQARHVVGEHGAALANIMFCRPGARVLELFNPAGAQPAHWALASLCGLDYGYLVGRHAPDPGGSADYTIDPKQLAAGLRAMLR